MKKHEYFKLPHWPAGEFVEVLLAFGLVDRVI